MQIICANGGNYIETYRGNVELHVFYGEYKFYDTVEEFIREYRDTMTKELKAVWLYKEECRKRRQVELHCRMLGYKVEGG